MTRTFFESVQSLIIDLENIPSNLTVDEKLEAIDICNKKTI